MTSAGLVGPDEPRYAAIGREMAMSGDVLTPRLSGAAWFEKPPLEYWGIAAAYRAGLDDDTAPRLFNALAGAVFVLLFFRAVRRLFGSETAWNAAMILACSAAWIAESRVAVMDLPLAATFCGAVLAALLGAMPLAGALLGLAMLAKGLVPLVLIAPLVWMERARWRGWMQAAIACIVVAGPWYAAMLAVHGRTFFDEFILRHHFSRFSSGALQHVQPWWFYAPVFAGLLFPWFPLLTRVRWPQDRRMQTILVTASWALLFFSISKNKLPGYILPAIPLTAILLGAAAKGAPRWLWAICGALMGLVPIAATVLPDAIAGGLQLSALRGSVPAALAAAALGVVAARWQALRGVAALMLLAVLALASKTLPALDERASARALWRLVEMRRESYCVESIHRAWRYGLDFYSGKPLPDCAREPKPLRITQERALPPQIVVAVDGARY